MKNQINNRKSKIIHLIAACVILTAFGPPAAPAQVERDVTAGPWTAFHGRSETGHRECGVMVTGRGAFFSIKYFKGDNHLSVHLIKDTWRVPEGAQINCLMQFDNNSPWSATATAFHLKDGRAALDFSISAQYVDRWIEEFAAGDVLYIRFPGSDVEEWEANLRGTRTIARTLAQCINEM